MSKHLDYKKVQRDLYAAYRSGALNYTHQNRRSTVMPKHKYLPIEEAPKDGTPIIGVCGGVEMCVAYDDSPFLDAWVYWDEDENRTAYQKAKPQPLKWRRLL